MRTFFFVLILTTLALGTHAQDSATPTAPPIPTTTPAARQVALRFVPPPIEGTISLGIYDAAGRLVRVLHREDGVSDFTAGSDALETSWDGEDDDGVPLPAGKYHARGYRIGDLKVEGIDNFFNDWVTGENSPHIARIAAISLTGDHLVLRATTSAEQEIFAKYDLASGDLAVEDATPTMPLTGDTALLESAGAVIQPAGFAPGKDGTIWAIGHVSKDGSELEVEQFSVTPTAAPGAPRFAVLRRLAIPPNEPQPIGIAASTTAERIFLLEEAPDRQRVRSLTLVATQPDTTNRQQSISDWKIDFEKNIVAHKNFVLIDGKPVVSASAAPPAPSKITQKLRPNPLQQDEPGKVDLTVGIDSDGSYLQTADGLPLRTISETPNLARALLARRPGNAVDVFQDDGAVVEQYRVSNLEEMIAFDCGEFDLK